MWRRKTQNMWFCFFFFKLEFIDRNIMSWREMEESESRWQELWRSFLFLLVGVGGQQALWKSRESGQMTWARMNICSALAVSTWKPLTRVCWWSQCWVLVPPSHWVPSSQSWDTASVQGCAAPWAAEVGKGRSLVVCAGSAGTGSFSQLLPSSSVGSSGSCTKVSSLGLWMGCSAPHCWRNFFIPSSWSCCDKQSTFLGVRRWLCSTVLLTASRTEHSWAAGCPLSLRNQSCRLLSARAQAGGCTCTQAPWAWITYSVFGGIEPKVEAQGSCCLMHHQSQQLSRRIYSLFLVENVSAGIAKSFILANSGRFSLAG